jgi:integrase
MRRREPARVLGPYQEGATWRVIHIDGAGRRKSHRLGDEQSARRLKRKLERRIESEPPITLGELINRFLAYLTDVRAVRPNSIAVVRSGLQRFFGEVPPRSPLFTREAAEAWYKAHTEKISERGTPLAVATHQLDLKVARRLYLWAGKKGLVRENPWQGIEPIGRARAGKEQLRVDEARRFVDGALSDLQGGDTDTLAPLMALLMGLRASEVMGRTARDVDDGGRLLWIDSGKTDHSRRHLRVPSVLAQHLARLATERQGEPYLFGAAKGGRAPTQRLGYIVQRLCVRYGVPKVCPHSLRGLYATLAMEQGAIADMVAASLGHASFTITARHYAKPQAVRHAKTERVLAMLDRSAIPTGTTAPLEVGCAATQDDAAPAVAEFLSPAIPAAASTAAPTAASTADLASLTTLLAKLSRAPRTAESPLIAWLSAVKRHKPARVLGPYQAPNGYRLIVRDGPHRKSLVLSSLEQAEALREELATVINRSQSLPRPEKT